MITLQVKRSITLPVDQSILVNAAQVALLQAGQSSDADVTIVIAGDRLLQKLNRQYRGVNTTTDVLSFPFGETDPDTSAKYLGDILISLPRATQQAAAENHPLEDELQLLVAHGILHLVGFDHIQGDERRQMQLLQDKILNSLGLDLAITL
jgi:probable rRNA maturation factor